MYSSQSQKISPTKQGLSPIALMPTNPGRLGIDAYSLVVSPSRLDALLARAATRNWCSLPISASRHHSRVSRRDNIITERKRLEKINQRFIPVMHDFMIEMLSLSGFRSLANGYIFLGKHLGSSDYSIPTNGTI